MSDEFHSQFSCAAGRLRAVLAGSLSSLALLACTANPVSNSGSSAAASDLLNSDRIRTRYGNYGVEIVAQDQDTRVSSLYSSNESNCRTIRTLALVRFHSSTAARVSASHQRIVAGSSIGETLRSAGYPVIKRHIGAANLARHSHHAVVQHFPDSQERTAIATHKYVLEINIAGKQEAYATIVEIHHPDYLSLQQLEAIFGPLPTSPISAQESADLLAHIASFPVSLCD